MANNINTSNDFWAKYGVDNKQRSVSDATKKASEDPNAMGKTEFLELMMAQLENQDPMSPQGNTEFIAQMAQFSMVEGIQNLNKTSDSLVDSFKSSQALQASALVGRKVQIEGDSATLNSGEGMSGNLVVPPGSENLTAHVTNAAGQLVKTLDLSNHRMANGSYPSGELPFEWDGLDSEGQPAAAGSYSVVATASVGGSATRLNSNVNINVDSVTLGNGGQVSLNLAGYGSVRLTDVKEFH